MSGRRCEGVQARISAGRSGKMRMPFILGVLALSIALPHSSQLAASGNSAAAKQKLSARQTEIMRTVQSVDGYLDKKLYDEFWSIMPPEIKIPANRFKLKKLLSEVSFEREKFITESWLSAKASLEAGRVVRTQGYIVAQKLALEASNNQSYKANIAESITSGERLIEAAAKGTPLDTPGGKKFITSDVIEHVLSGVKASEFRVAKLVSPSWDGRTIEFRYPEAHVSVLATFPFALERTKVKVSEGREIEMVLLNQRLNVSTVRAISFIPTGSNFIDPNKSVVSIANAGLTGSGATAITHTASTDWRGKTSATVTGSAKTSDGEIFVSLRVVAIPALNGVVQFMVSSNLSGAEAINARSLLEESSNIILN